jgi:uncharacterized membrane protein YphA (DoxX/SURF4 family)
MFDEFALSGADLAIFRVVYALAALLLLVPDFEIVNRYPDTFYSPPPGIMAVFTRFPPAWVPTALEIGIAIGLVAILVGYMTTLASWATTFMWLYGNGLVYSMAKINHGSLLFSITPVFLSLAGWGNRFSLDAWRRGRYRIVRRWPLTLFAVTIGGMFVTAAIPKIEAGWLHLSTHAVQRAVIAAGSGPEFATEILKIHSPIFWEGVDYSTILLVPSRAERGSALSRGDLLRARHLLRSAGTGIRRVRLLAPPRLANVAACGTDARGDGTPGATADPGAAGSHRRGGSRPAGIRRPIRLAEYLLRALQPLHRHQDHSGDRIGRSPVVSRRARGHGGCRNPTQVRAPSSGSPADMTQTVDARSRIVV